MPAGLKHWRRNGCGATARARKQGVKAVAKALSAGHVLAGYRRHGSRFCATTPRADLGADARIIAFDLACAVDQWRMATSTNDYPAFCRAQLASGPPAGRYDCATRLSGNFVVTPATPATSVAIRSARGFCRGAVFPDRAIRLAGTPDRPIRRLDHPTRMGFCARPLRSKSGARARHQGKLVPALGPWRRAGRARSCPTNGERTDAWLQPPAGLALNSDTAASPTLRLADGGGIRLRLVGCRHGHHSWPLQPTHAGCSGLALVVRRRTADAGAR